MRARLMTARSSRQLVLRNRAGGSMCARRSSTREATSLISLHSPQPLTALRLASSPLMVARARCVSSQCSLPWRDTSLHSLLTVRRTSRPISTRVSTSPASSWPTSSAPLSALPEAAAWSSCCVRLVSPSSRAAAEPSRAWKASVVCMWKATRASAHCAPTRSLFASSSSVSFSEMSVMTSTRNGVGRGEPAKVRTQRVASTSHHVGSAPAARGGASQRMEIVSMALRSTSSSTSPPWRVRATADALYQAL
mmetsp:Transcript_28589/g.77000  ORF Transcript_28589/g.77000 Transcript_28589/m.77000 type:complete len:251 (+) Transcript_28589:568-1320(+)